MINSNSIAARVSLPLQDVAYFFLKSSLSSRVDLDLHQNPSLSKASRDAADPDREFWRRVAPAQVAAIARAYRLDLEMFGYSASKYLHRLGLPVPPQVEEDERNPLMAEPG